MADARKVFPMQTFVSFLRAPAGTYKQDVMELLQFATQQDVDKELAPFASALTKAWIYEQHPELARLKKEEVSELGDNVSILSLPTDAQEEADTVFSKLNEYRQTLKEQKDKLAEYEGVLEENKKKIAALESKVADYEAQMKNEGEKQIIASASKVEDYIKKVDDLLSKIDEVKKHGVVTVSGEGGAAAAAPEGAAGGGGPAEPEPDFGFGGSAGGDDEFGF